MQLRLELCCSVPDYDEAINFWDRDTLEYLFNQNYPRDDRDMGQQKPPFMGFFQNLLILL